MYELPDEEISTRLLVWGTAFESGIQKDLQNGK